MTDEARDSIEDRIDDLPPSAKLVVKVLEYEGSATQKEISTATRLNPSTTRYAVKKLVDNDLVDVTTDSSETRRLVYTLKGLED